MDRRVLYGRRRPDCLVSTRKPALTGRSAFGKTGFLVCVAKRVEAVSCWGVVRGFACDKRSRLRFLKLTVEFKIKELSRYAGGGLRRRTIRKSQAKSKRSRVVLYLSILTVAPPLAILARFVPVQGSFEHTEDFMNCKTAALRFFLLLLLSAGTVAAQSEQSVPEGSLVSKSVTAIGFPVGGGDVKVDLKGTELMTQAIGEAKVEAKQAKTNIEVNVTGLEQPTKLGAEFLTYVLWAVTPDGRTGNLGELLVNKNGEAKLNTTTPAQTFSMVVTAEPYFAVRLPSEVVVMESETRKNTKGKLFPVKEYKLMKRGQYEKLGNPLAMTPDIEHIPLELYEARNAVDIAKSRGAEADALEIFSKAKGSLEAAENALARKADKKEIISTSRQTVQFAEDARA